jgi:hypothetical protein
MGWNDTDPIASAVKAVGFVKRMNTQEWKFHETHHHAHDIVRMAPPVGYLPEVFSPPRRHPVVRERITRYHRTVSRKILRNEQADS